MDGKIRLILTICLAVNATACSNVKMSSASSDSGSGAALASRTNESGGTTDQTNQPADPSVIPGLTSLTAETIYLKMTSATPDGVKRSSTLTLANNSCYLNNFYDFPDWIFGDDSLDNTTTTPLSLPVCERLALAEAIRSAGGACVAGSVALTAAEKAAIHIDSTSAGMLSLMFPSLQGVSASDLSSSLNTIDLDADCVCSITVAPPGNSTLSSTLTLPPDLNLCQAKFARYSAQALSSAASTIQATYGTIH